MNPQDDHLLVMRVKSSAALSLAAEHASAASAPSRGRGTLSCSHPFCERPATNGDLCEHHAELMADIRAEYEQLQAEFQDGWD